MNVILQTYSEYIRALNAVIEAMPIEQIGRDVKIKGTPLNLVMRLGRVYHGAESRAGNFGYIGVGSISFAEHRMQRFQRRTLLRALIIMDDRHFGRMDAERRAARKDTNVPSDYRPGRAEPLLDRG